MMTKNKVAIIGYGFRMPGNIRNENDFWELLEKREIVRVPIEDRYGKGYQPFNGKAGPGRFASAYEGLMIDDQELIFDCKLFGLSSYEAKHMDPQIKLLLTCSWEAIEHAGLDMRKLKNSNTGVFIGTQISPTGNWRSPVGTNEFIVPGSSLSMFANRISYHFNLMGPSTTTLTACSSGISALHAAMNSIKCGDCSQALVGSSSYLGSYFASTGFGSLGVISPDGKCYSFDEKANGYMRSEGVFVYVLKELDQAIKDGDKIHAVIQDTFLNTAGAEQGTKELLQGRYITAPTAHAQVALMNQAFEKTGLTPYDFDYIEAHATGTKLGDKIEGNAIGEVFGAEDRTTPLRISGVKSNVGHMEAAAFHCSLLKALLMYKHRKFAPVSKNYQIPNPEINFDKYNMEVQTVSEPFPDHQVRIGINSFGFGGANGICILEEFVPENIDGFSKPINKDAAYLFPISARSSDAIISIKEDLKSLILNGNIDVYTLAGNLSKKRTHFHTRSYFVARNHKELMDELYEFDEEKIKNTMPETPRVAMIFSGQGTQWAGCGKDLYDTYLVFRRTIDEIDSYWKKLAGFSIKQKCFTVSQEELNECALAQPSIFMIQCGLVELYKTWGIYPQVVLGHSAGEMGAVYASGGLSLEEATKLVYHRATVQQLTSGSGRMLAIGSDRESVEHILKELDIDYDSKNENPQVEFACFNAPTSIVLCGVESELEPVIDLLTERKISKKLLAGNIAFHSTKMEAIKNKFYNALSWMDDLSFDFDIPFVSTVTGKVETNLNCDYWWANIRQPVDFNAGIKEAYRLSTPDIFLEVSPHNALSPLVLQCLDHVKREVECVTSLTREGDSVKNFNNSLGILYQKGIELDFEAQFPKPIPIPDLLPKHPKEEQVVIEKLIDEVHFDKKGEYSWGPLIGRKEAHFDMGFMVRMSKNDFPWLTDHVVHQVPIVPAAGYIEMILEAFGKTENKYVHFDSIDFLSPCEVTDTAVRLQTVLDKIEGTSSEYKFSITSKPYTDDVKRIHCQGRVALKNKENFSGGTRLYSQVDQKKFEPTRFNEKKDFYEHMLAVIGENYQYGPIFQVINQVKINQDTKELLFELEMDPTLFQESMKNGYILPPPLMDGGLQSFIYFLMVGTDVAGIPIRAKNFSIFGSPSSPNLVCHYTPNPSLAKMQQKGQLSVALGEQFVGTLEIYDKISGQLIVRLGEYYGFHTNTKRGDIKYSKSKIQWQPKFIEELVALNEQITISEILSQLENRDPQKNYICRFIEFAQEKIEKNTILENCIKHLSSDSSQSEYWIFNHSDELVEKQFQYFNHNASSLRFDKFDVKEAEKTNLNQGLLRAHCAEAILILNQPEFLTPGSFTLYSEILVEGGILIIKKEDNHKDITLTKNKKEWKSILNTSSLCILQNTISYHTRYAYKIVDTPKYAIQLGSDFFYNSEDILLTDFVKFHHFQFNGHSDIQQDLLIKWQSENPIHQLDFFISPDDNDPTGVHGFTAFITLIQPFLRVRQRVDSPHCLLRIVTYNSSYEITNVPSAVFWGGIRSLTHELSKNVNLTLQLIDIGDKKDLEILDWLSEIPIREREIVVRGKKIYVPRVLSIYDEFYNSLSNGTQAFKLFVEAPGQISGLLLKTYDLPVLEDNEVEIEVKAAALNFRDVMVMLGKLPLLSYERSALGHEVGMEACGVITKIGKGVKNRKIADEVVFMMGGCIANKIVTNETSTFHKPKNLSSEQAAGILSVYVTAYYALVYLARLRKGQRVLIHSALGGVGQAAISIAKNIGAEIYTTAGNEEKRSKLIELGAVATYDSHSYSWYDDLQKDTNGEGVDVILNSLAGNHIRLCLESLKPGGYHCEIGKVDIYADNALDMCVFRKNLRFIAIDVDRLMKDDPELSLELTEKCLELISNGTYSPIPVTTYSIFEYEKAIRSMMNGEHKGKLILNLENHDASNFKVAEGSRFLSSEATYLVTGGFGGFGLQLVAFLADAGATHITMMDRDVKRKRSAEWVKKQNSLNLLYPNTEIDIIQGDVANNQDVLNCISKLKRPLKGVFHLAGIIDDRLIANLDKKSIESVFLPKAQGALNLHYSTLDLALDHFVLISSIASVFGSPAQINYSASNSFLDALAIMRVQNGLPGLSFNMAAVAEAGMASRDAHVLRMAKTSGIPPISALFAFHALDFGMRAPKQNGQFISAVFKNIRWDENHPDYMRFGRLIKNQEIFKKGTSSQFTQEAIVQKIANKVANLCGHEEIDPKEPIASFGLNSISVSELGAFINAQFNYQASVIDLMSKATTISLAESILSIKDGIQSDAELKNDETIQDNKEKEKENIPEIKIKRRKSIFAPELKEHFHHSIHFSLDKTKIQTDFIQIEDLDSKSKNRAPDINYNTNKDPIHLINEGLPLDCQNDLNSIKNHIRHLIDSGNELGPSKKPSRFKEVLLTGATGFIGRFVLCELLESDPNLLIYCVVRADSIIHAHDRIKRQMQIAGIWKQHYAQKIIPVVGDIGKEKLGTDKAFFKTLSVKIDAIYHFAADLTLASPYNQIRNINTVSIKNILTLAYTGQLKPIFYASTLGIFPQYFSQFRNEFSEMEIQHQMMPDINLMKEKFPLGFVGYPWSKLVVEQSLLFAQKLGLPLAIFRLPVTGIAAKTGFTQSNDIKVKVVSASFNMGIKPEGMEFHWSEPVDTLAKICTSISLNNDRLHTIYQCANPNPETYGIDFEDFGFELQEVSYEKFKAENQSFGSQSPLEGYWTLLDYFAPYWFSKEKTSALQPISDKAIREDCQFEIKWPGLLEMTSNSYKWIHENQDHWPYEMFQSVLNEKSIIDMGENTADYYGLKFSDVYRKKMLEGLTVLVNSIKTESEVRNDRSSIISLNLHRIMKNLALIEKQRKLYPEINDIKLEKPIFIVGINRTGTTFLHHLFSLDDIHSTLKIYEPAMPVGQPNLNTVEPNDDFRIQYVKDVLASYDAHEKLRGIHNIDINAPEEDFLLLEHAFYSWSYTILYKIPKYEKWLENTNPRFAYEFHKKAMQNIIFQRPESENKKQWIFKMPFHLMELETLIKIYPDALFIQTHRDPKKFMSSWNHLVFQARTVFAPHISKEFLGKEQLDFMSKMLNKATEFRLAHPELENRWIDIDFTLLISDPIAVIKGLYTKLGKDINENQLQKIENWVSENNKKRQKEGINTHKLKDFDLSDSKVDLAFAPYMEFISNLKVGA